MIESTDAAFSAAIRACVTDFPRPWTNEATRRLQDDYHRHELKKEVLLMIEWSYAQITFADDENYIVVGESKMGIFTDNKDVDIYSFPNFADCHSGLQVCKFLRNEESARMLPLTKANGVDVIVFACDDSTRHRVFSFTEKAARKTACDMIERIWLLSRADEIAEEAERLDEIQASYDDENQRREDEIGYAYDEFRKFRDAAIAQGCSKEEAAEKALNIISDPPF